MTGYLSVLRAIAHAVRDAVEDAWERREVWGRKVGKGADGTPTSLIDKIAEDAAMEELESLDPPLSVLTEERGYVNRGYSKVLVMDPVDGTYNAEKGIPFYSVSLAVAEKSLEGVTHALILNIPANREYHAVAGQGAYCCGRRISVRPFRREDSLFVINLGWSAPGRWAMATLRPKRSRSLGAASLEFALLAQGSADLVVYCFERGGALRVVDVAAAYLLVREAGGRMVDDSLNPLRMPLSLRVRKNVIAFADEAVLGEVGI